MGNQTSRGAAKGKIVHWDGSVKELEKAMTVAEVMMEHPQHVVVELNCALTHRRPTPLPADSILDINTNYLMLPIKRGKAVGLNAQDSRRFLLILNSRSKSSSMLLRRTPSSNSRFVPWLSRTCHANVIGHHKNEQFMEKQTTSQRFLFPHDDLLGETLLEGTTTPQYLSRQCSEKVWKPSLDTITENTIPAKASLTFFFKPFYTRFHEI